MDINARLERLERENRRMKKIGIVGIVFASVAFMSGQAKTNKVVEANEFILRDGSGKVRARLSMEVDRPSLTFYDGSGGLPLSLSGRNEPFVVLNRVGTEETVQLGANQGFSGVGIYEKNIRAGLSVQNGVPALDLYDVEGKPRASMFAEKNETRILLTNSKSTMVSSLCAGSPGTFGAGAAITGAAGAFRVNLNTAISPGPQLALEDTEGYSTQIGRTDLVATKTGKKEQTPAASLVLFDKDKKVMWSAP